MNTKQTIQVLCKLSLYNPSWWIRASKFIGISPRAGQFITRKMLQIHLICLGLTVSYTFRASAHINETMLCQAANGRCLTNLASCPLETHHISGKCENHLIPVICCISRQVACQMHRGGFCTSSPVSCQSRDGYHVIKMSCDHARVCCAPHASDCSGGTSRRVYVDSVDIEDVFRPDDEVSGPAMLEGNVDNYDVIRNQLAVIRAPRRGAANRNRQRNRRQLLDRV